MYYTLGDLVSKIMNINIWPFYKLYPLYNWLMTKDYEKNPHEWTDTNDEQEG